MSVSLSMIVRNEASNLEACILPVRDLVDDIVVVDTGSTDATRQVANSLGARVFDVPWCDSFAVARNASIEGALGDWIFCLDADDRVVPPERAKLEKLFAQLGDDNVGYLMGHVCLGPDGGFGMQADQVRLFRRHPDIRWEYRVHEQIAASITAAGGRIQRTGIRILHTGFQDQAVVDAKVQRNLRLVELDCAEMPLDAFPAYYRGVMLVELGRFAEAMVALNLCRPVMVPGSPMALGLCDELSRAQRAEGEFHAALETAREGRAMFPDNATLACREAELLVELGDLVAAGACLLDVTGPERRDWTSSDLRARVLLAEIHISIGRYEEAERLAREVTRARPGYGTAWLALADAVVAQGRPQDLDAILSELAPVRRAHVTHAALKAARLAHDHLHTEAMALLAPRTGTPDDELLVRLAARIAGAPRDAALVPLVSCLLYPWARQPVPAPAAAPSVVMRF